MCQIREIPFCVKHVILEEVALKYLVKEAKVYTKLWCDVFSFVFVLK
jgi:hypothetical protein